MKHSKSLAALLAGVFFAAGASAAALKGSKSSLTLTLTATSEIGGFLVSNAKIETDGAKGIEYWSVANPFGYSDETKNYYRNKYTTKSQNFGTTDEPYTLTTSSVYEEQTKLFSEKFTNVDFIEALIERELVPLTSAKGYKLVAVFPAEWEEPLFFIENGESIYYVGRMNGSAAGSFDALIISSDDDEVETLSYKSTHAYKHKKVDGEVVVDEVGTHTESDSGSGKVELYVSLFGGYWDSGAEEWIDFGTSLWYGGLGSFSGAYNAKADLFLMKSVTLAASATSGAFYDEDYDSAEDRGNLVTGGVSLGSAKVVADIQPYLDALPEGLSELKAEIIASYGEIE